MKEFNTEAVRIETASALETVRLAQAFVRYPAYIELDVHKETIVVAVARAAGMLRSQGKRSPTSPRRWPSWSSVLTGSKARWNQAHYNWLESLKFPHDRQQVVLQEYIDEVKAASQRVAGITAQMERVLPQWSLSPVVDSLVALRCITRQEM